LWLPGAKWCPVTYRAEAGKFTGGNPIGYIPHVQQGNGSLFGYFNRLTSPNRKFSTAWIAKDGHSEQYTELTSKPWSQAAGNATYWAFECEGYVGEPLTAPQINTLAIWHNFLGVADIIALAPGQHGIGTHVMGGLAWGGHSCPGPIRAAQRPAIIARAKALRAVPLPGSVSPLPPALVTKLVPKPARNIPQTVAIQRACHVAADGKWGPGTQSAATAVIRRTLSNVRWLQARVGTKVDGAWGPQSQAAWVATVKRIQTAIHVTPDGAWGPISSRAWAHAVANNYKRY